MKQIYPIKIFLASILFLLISINSFGQNYTMSNSPITTCSGTWMDPGGTNHYSNSQNFTQTITATDGQLQITFNSFETESVSFDWLEIYDGASTNSALIGRYGGTNNPGTITATGSSLTFVFHSDGSVNRSGWSATLSCYNPIPTAMTSSTLNTCSLYYADPGGENNYNNNLNMVQTINSDIPNAIGMNITFSAFSLSAGDTLWIHAGNSTNSPLIGTYTGTQLPGNISTPSLSVTFHFVSNNTGNSIGWLANISCEQCISVSTLQGSPCFPDVSSSTGVAASPFCEDENPYGITFPSETGTNFNGYDFFGLSEDSNVGCLLSIPRPSWYYMQINTPGNLLLQIEQNSIATGIGLDVDFACWGPFQATDQNDFLQKLCCGEYEFHINSHSSHVPSASSGNHTNDMGGYPYGNLIDCSYSYLPYEWCYIPNAQSGEFYLLLLTNYNGGAANISFNSVAQYSTANTNCELLALVTNNGPLCEGDTLQLICNNNQTNATFAWSGPNGFTSTAQNPTIPNVGTQNSGEYTLVITAGGHSSAPATTTVVVNSNPELQLNVTDSILCLGESAQISVSGATNYTWNQGLSAHNNQNVTPTSTTTYTVIGSNNNCSDTASVEISVVPPPVPNIVTPSGTFCPTIGSVNINATISNGTNPIQYNYTGANFVNPTSQNSEILIDSSDCNQVILLTLNVTDFHGCTGMDTASITILDNSAPVVTLPIAAQDAEINNLQYVIPDLSDLVENLTSDNCWENAQLTFTQSIAAGTPITTTTTVTVTVTDPCNNTTQVSIVIEVPDALIPAITDQNNISCFGGNDGTISVQVVGGVAPYSYNWSCTPPQTTAQAQNLPAGTYTVTISDVNGITTTISATLTQPDSLQLTYTKETATCDQANGAIFINISGGTTPYNYNWSNGSTSANLTNVTAGEYTLTVTDANECTITITDSIANIPGPVIDSIEITDETCHLTNGAITISHSGGTAPYHYQWSEQTVNQPNINNLSTGNYSVTIEDANGCIVEAETFVGEFSFTAGVESVTPDICEQQNGTATLFAQGGSGNYTYDWRNVENFEENRAFDLAAGTYSVTVIDSVCQIPLNFTITSIPIPIACIEMTSTIAQYLTNQSIQFLDCSDFTTDWFWDFGDNSHSTLQNPSHIFTNAGTYIITLTASNEYGCTDSDSISITINESGLVYIPNSFTPNGDGLNDIFKPICTYIQPVDFNMYIFNRWGNEVFRTSDINAGWDGTINGQKVHQVTEFNFIIFYRDLTGKPFKESGSVLLIP